MKAKIQSIEACPTLNSWPNVRAGIVDRPTIDEIEGQLAPRLWRKLQRSTPTNSCGARHQPHSLVR